jgi:hypothetical protein
MPANDWVEGGMLEFAASAVETDWILRMDDDEFPSRSLLEWLSQGFDCNMPCFALSRRELLRTAAGVFYSRLKTHYVAMSTGALFLDPQLRLYRPKAVRYCRDLHSPGIETSFGYAPQEAYFVHLDTIVRNPEERLAKMRRYDRIKAGSSWRFGFHYLPELFPDVDQKLTSLKTDEFDSLLSLLPGFRQDATASLTEAERTLIIAHTEKLTAHIGSNILAAAFNAREPSEIFKDSKGQ